MRKITAIAMLHLKTLFISPAAIMLMFVMPIMFSLIFGGIGSGNSAATKPVVVIIGDNDETSKQIITLLAANKQYTWRESTKKEANELVNAQQAIAALQINSDITDKIVQKAPVFTIMVQRKTQEYEALRRYVDGVGSILTQTFQLTAGQDSGVYHALLDKVADREPIIIKQQVIQKDSTRNEWVSLLAVGFTIMFMMFGISGAASTILDERSGGTWQRLLTSPTAKIQVMAGYLLSYFLMGWVQLVVLMVTMKFVFGAVWGKLAYFIPFATLVIITIVGFGLMMATIVKTRQQSSALSTVLIVSTCMLGGVYWPLDIVPEFMKQLSKAVPQSWMISGLQEIISGSLYTDTIVNAVFALSGFSAVFFTIALKKIKFY